MYLSILLSLINSVSLLSMYGEGEIDNSQITCVPTIKGLGLTYYFGDKYYGETENTLLMIKQKQFDPNNTSCHNKLRKAIIELCCEKPNIPKTIALVSSMTQHFRATESPANLKKLNLEIASFCNIHTFLGSEKEIKQMQLKATIEASDRKFLIQYNEQVKNFKQLCIDQIGQLKKIRSEHIDNRNSQIKQTGQEIKEIKKALVNLHKLNQKQKVYVPKNKNININIEDEYCSDTEKNSEDVQKSYSDENLIAKIGVDAFIKLNNRATQDQINQIDRILSTFYAIQPLNT
jgi:hypothetical protein